MVEARECAAAEGGDSGERERRHVARVIVRDFPLARSKMLYYRPS